MKSIRLYGRRGGFALVDDEDEALVRTRKNVIRNKGEQKWYAQPRYSTTYAFRYPDGLGMHRLIMGLGLKKDDPREVDHINHDGLDNRKANLRICTRSQQMMNRRGWKASKRKHPLPKGITLDEGWHKGRLYAYYRVRIMVNGQNVEVGHFKTLEEAKDAHEQASREHHGEFGFLSNLR
jgi:hypothetical protein